MAVAINRRQIGVWRMWHSTRFSLCDIAARGGLIYEFENSCVMDHRQMNDKWIGFRDSPLRLNDYQSSNLDIASPSHLPIISLTLTSQPIPKFKMERNDQHDGADFDLDDGWSCPRFPDNTNNPNSIEVWVIIPNVDMKGQRSWD